MNILYFGPENSYYKRICADLNEQGYNVSLVSDLESLGELFSKASLLLLDYEFDKKNEYKNLNKIKEVDLISKKKNLPIVYFSESDDLDIRIKIFEKGIDDLVDKFDFKSLYYKINSHLKPNTLWQGINAIVIEDDKISAKFISHVLKSKGAHVQHFDDSLEAYTYLKDHPQIDLILTDHMMPNLSGLQLVKKIRNEIGMRFVPIVFISSVQNKAEILEFYKAGGNEYLSKPLIKEELYVKVNQLLDNNFKSKILREKVDELEQVNRIKDKFLAVCTHDLRTPLNTIIGLTDMIIEEESFAENSDTLSYLKRIDNSANSLLELVNELLDFSEMQLKRRQVELKPIDIVSLIKQSVRNFTAINQKHINIQFQSQYDNLLIDGNKQMLIRVFNNILSNAYKFTPEGGSITTRVECDKESIFISIKDSGIGIPKVDQGKIFQEFSVVGRKGLKGEKSIGLGMSIVKKIIDDHNAKISLNSVEGRGTTFTLEFKKAV